MLSYQAGGWLLVGKWDVLGTYEPYMLADNDECWLPNTVQVISCALFIYISAEVGAIYDQSDEEAILWRKERSKKCSKAH